MWNGSFHVSFDDTYTHTLHTSLGLYVTHIAPLVGGCWAYINVFNSLKYSRCLPVCSSRSSDQFRIHSRMSTTNETVTVLVSDRLELVQRMQTQTSQTRTGIIRQKVNDSDYVYPVHCPSANRHQTVAKQIVTFFF